MTIWAVRIADIGDWERVQNLFEEHFKALKGPREMMLIWGFVEIQPDQLPKTAALLVGHQDSFEKLFSFPDAHQRR